MKPVEVQIASSEICVLIKGLPHLMLRRQDVSGFQAYYKTTGVRDPLYFIEFTTSRGAVISDYNDRSLWEMILKELRKSKMFDHMLGENPLPGSA